MAGTGSSRGVKLALVVGFLALALGVVGAHQRPATGYEVSVYGATPLSFWVGVGVALLVSLAVALSGYRDRYAGAALALGGGAILSIASLPVVRGYHFHGHHDALTHLGWTRQMVGGTLDPTALIYPGGHLVGTTASHLSDIDPRRTLMLIVPVFVLLYLVFVTLTVRTLVPETGATVAGALVAFLLLPISNIAGSLKFIPFSLAVLFTPLFVYLLVRYVARPRRGIAGLAVTPLDVLLVGTGASLLLLHPQVFSDVLLLVGSVAALQFLYRRFAGRSRISEHRWALGQFLVLAGLFVLWTANHPATAGTLERLLTLSGAAADDTIVQQRVGSLGGIGVSLAEVFAKLFLVNVVVLLFAGWLVAKSLYGGTREVAEDLDAWVRYLLVTGVLVAIYGGVHFFAAVSSSYFFRHLSFGMVLASILGAAGLYMAGRGLRSSLPRAGVVGNGATTVGVAVALVAIALSLAVVFPSPYIYNQSHHVTSSQLSGYENAFEHRADGVDFMGIRGGEGRYSDALLGDREIASEAVYGEAIRAGLPSQVESDRYLVVTDVDRQREVQAYRELRVSRSDFQQVDSQVGVSRVQSNGGFELYYVDELE